MLKGLPKDVAEAILKRDGINAITPPKQTPEIVKLLYQMFSGFSTLLWFGCILCFVAFSIQELQTPGGSREYVREEEVGWVAFVSDMTFFLSSSFFFPLQMVIGVVLAVVVIITGCFSYYQVAGNSSRGEGTITWCTQLVCISCMLSVAV